MNIATALEIIAEIQDEMGEDLLETLLYVSENLDQFNDHRQEAFRVAFAGFRELFAAA